jgi:hypothetical protein
MYSANGTQQTYVESIVYPWWDETSETWIWTARCAKDSCTYKGWFFFGVMRLTDSEDHSVKINRYFQLRMQNTQVYPLRG